MVVFYGAAYQGGFVRATYTASPALCAGGNHEVRCRHLLGTLRNVHFTKRPHGSTHSALPLSDPSLLRTGTRERSAPSALRRCELFGRATAAVVSNGRRAGAWCPATRITPAAQQSGIPALLSRSVIDGAHLRTSSGGSALCSWSCAQPLAVHSTCNVLCYPHSIVMPPAQHHAISRRCGMDQTIC